MSTINTKDVPIDDSAAVGKNNQECDIEGLSGRAARHVLHA